MLTSIHDLLLIEKNYGGYWNLLRSMTRRMTSYNIKYCNGKSCFFHIDVFTTFKLLSNVSCRHRGKNSEADMMNICMKYSFYCIEFCLLKFPLNV